VEWFSDRKLSARATRRMNGNASAGIGITQCESIM
jgi:hypothetical protein